MQFTKGMRDKLDKYFNIQDEIEVLMEISGDSVYDFSCFGVDSDNRLSDERYMIFYNQMQAPNNEIVLESDNERTGRFKVYLDRLPNHICKLVFTVTIDGNGTMATVDYHKISVLQNGSEGIMLSLTGKEFVSEKAIISVEIYKKDCWRIAAVANGFNSGLSALLQYFGGVEAAQVGQGYNIEDVSLNMKRPETDAAYAKENSEKSKDSCLQNNSYQAEPQILMDKNTVKSGNRTSSHKRIIAAVANGFNNGLSAVLKHFSGEEATQSDQNNKIEDTSLDVKTSKIETINAEDNSEELTKINLENNTYKTDSQLSIDENDAELGSRTCSHKRMIAYRVVIVFNKRLESISIDGDEMEDISAIQDKQIEDWFVESNGRSGWRGLISEIKEQVGDDQAELNFEFQGAKEYKEIFEKCLSELGLGSSAEGMSKDEIAQIHMKDAQKAEHRKLFKQAFESYKKAADYGDLAEAQYKVGEYYYQCNKGEFDGIKVEQEDAVAKAIAYCEKAAEQGYLKAKHRLFVIFDERELFEEAFRWIEELAKNGDMEAQYELGNYYYNGKGVAQDLIVAVSWFQVSAEQEYALAQNNLGDCYKNGNGVEKDEKKAVEWYEKAAEQEYAVAQNNLGDCYGDGVGVEKDEKKAVEWYEKAAEQEYTAAQNNLGDCYRYGVGVEKDEKKAVEWYEKAAEQEYAVAQNNLGDCYGDGVGVEKDEKKAVEWYEKAAEQGYAPAQTYLGYCYWGYDGVEKDEKKAFEWYKKAAEQGDASAQRNLGDCYYCGVGVEENETKAVQWYEKAAKNAEGWLRTDLYRKLGDCYKYGMGVEKDEKSAFEWYKKAAIQRDAKAINSLGDCYKYGIGVEKDEKKAFEWYAKVGGDEKAQNNLGDCYRYGIGVEKDEKEAFEWYMKAAKQRYAPALKNISDCYRYGIGTENDEWYTKRWYARAIENGYKENEKTEREIFELYKKAAEQGDVSAQNNLGDCFRCGIGVEEDEKKALALYMKAAKQGYLPAKNNIGYCHEHGIGTRTDEEEAIVWYESAAEQGYAPAQNNFGECFENACGVEKDEKKAFEWYKKAAEQGYAPAQSRLGECYDWGRCGIEKDEKKAFEWYKKAAEQGDACAQCGLGKCYMYKMDWQKAFEWCKKAAEQGEHRVRGYLPTILCMIGKDKYPEWSQRWEEEDYLYVEFGL